MDEAKRLEIQAWLTKARLDLLSADWLLTSPDHLYNAVGFHCQQASEKVLKAYLTWRYDLIASRVIREEVFVPDLEKKKAAHPGP